MPGLTTEALLSAWEQGWAEPQNASRALALLSVASQGTSPAGLAGFSIGERDAQLLDLQQYLFGNQISALAVCPRCNERAELSFDVSEVRVPGPATEKGTCKLSWKQYEVEFRMPQSSDLLALIGPEGIGKKRLHLLMRILLRATCSGKLIGAEELPEELISAMEAGLQTADPRAEISLRLHCQSCGEEWSALFDISSFLWKELDAWAIRLLRDVHLLASAYGWQEKDILAMSPWRRQAYLSMVGG
jgi:hypothetical protein